MAFPAPGPIFRPKVPPFVGALGLEASPSTLPLERLQ